MKRNNTNHALSTLTAAVDSLRKLNFDSSIYWGNDVKELIEQIDLVIDGINDREHEGSQHDDINNYDTPSLEDSGIELHSFERY